MTRLPIPSASDSNQFMALFKKAWELWRTNPVSPQVSASRTPSSRKRPKQAQRVTDKEQPAKVVSEAPRASHSALQDDPDQHLGDDCLDFPTARICSDSLDQQTETNKSKVDPILVGICQSSQAFPFPLELQQMVLLEWDAPKAMW